MNPARPFNALMAVSKSGMFLVNIWSSGISCGWSSAAASAALATGPDCGSGTWVVIRGAAGGESGI